MWPHIAVIHILIVLMIPIIAYKQIFSGLKSQRRLGALSAAKFPKEARPDRRVLVLVANGSEEIETVTIFDTLVRCGTTAVLAAVGSPTLQVRCSRGVQLVADKHVRDCVSAEWDMVVCPGGMPGAQHFSQCPHVKGLLDNQNTTGKYIAAICAAPAVVLAHEAFARKMTCYPAPQFINSLGDRYVDKRVVVDGHIITSQGPGTALEFSLILAEILFGEDVAAEVKQEMIF